MTTVLQENVNGVRVVKAFNNEIFEMEKFEKRNSKYREKNRKLVRAMAYYWSLSDSLTLLQYLATVTYSIFLAENGLISQGDIIACLMYIGMLVWPIRGLGRIIGDFGKATVAASRINDILTIPTEYVSDGTLEPPITGNIEFKGVSFKFDDTDKHLLDGIDLSIKAGETVALIGKTGSGKSTIAASSYACSIMIMAASRSTASNSRTSKNRGYGRISASSCRIRSCTRRAFSRTSKSPPGISILNRL